MFLTWFSILFRSDLLYMLVFVVHSLLLLYVGCMLLYVVVYIVQPIYDEVQSNSKLLGICNG